jgi:hypothetical protein
MFRNFNCIVIEHRLILGGEYGGKDAQEQRAGTVG